MIQSDDSAGGRQDLQQSEKQESNGQGNGAFEMTWYEVSTAHPAPPVGYRPWRREFEIHGDETGPRAIALVFLASISLARAGVPQVSWTPENIHTLMDQFFVDLSADPAQEQAVHEEITRLLFEVFYSRTGKGPVQIFLEDKIHALTDAEIHERGVHREAQ